MAGCAHLATPDAKRSKAATCALRVGSCGDLWTRHNSAETEAPRPTAGAEARSRRSRHKPGLVVLVLTTRCDGYPRSTSCSHTRALKHVDVDAGLFADLACKPIDAEQLLLARIESIPQSSAKTALGCHAAQKASSTQPIHMPTPHNCHAQCPGLFGAGAGAASTGAAGSWRKITERNGSDAPPPFRPRGASSMNTICHSLIISLSARQCVSGFLQLSLSHCLPVCLHPSPTLSLSVSLARSTPITNSNFSSLRAHESHNQLQPTYKARPSNSQAHARR